MPQNILKMCLFLICRAAFQFLALTRAINATPLIAPPTQLQGQRQTQFTRLQKAQPGKKSDVIYISIGRLAFSISTLSVCNSQQVKTKGKPGWKYHDSESQRDRGKDTRSEQQLKNIQPLFTAWKQYKVKSQNGNKCKYFDGKLKGGGALRMSHVGANLATSHIVKHHYKQGGKMRLQTGCRHMMLHHEVYVFNSHFCTWVTDSQWLANITSIWCSHDDR